MPQSTKASPVFPAAPSPQHLYRVRVTGYPDGAFSCIHEEYDIWEPAPGWAPPGWEPEGNYEQMLGTSEFIWPVTSKIYHSRTTAKKRADLLNHYGATAVVERSAPIEWPDSAEFEATDEFHA